MRILGTSTALTLKRNAEGEPASAPAFTLDVHAPSMRLDDVLDQGQAEAAAWSRPGLLGARAIELDEDGSPIGFGTEIGAFLRLDDLQPGYAYGHLDRSIIMNPNQVNARIVFPVTTFNTVITGHKIDYILYANNYEEIDDDHPVIEKFNTPEWALDVFRNGAVMSKGTTTSTGLVHSYFANIFGPPEYREIHENIAKNHFSSFFKTGVFVGQMRTRLGIRGYEVSGPAEAAKELLKIIGA